MLRAAYEGHNPSLVYDSDMPCNELVQGFITMKHGWGKQGFAEDGRP